MCLPQKSFFAGEGRYRIELTAIITGDGISVTLTGGEKPHVGGVALCIPEPGMEDGFKTAEISLPGHRDTGAARPVAEMLCQLTGEKTAVVCGIHIDDACGWEIAKLLQNCVDAADELVKELTKEKTGDTDA